MISKNGHNINTNGVQINGDGDNTINQSNLTISGTYQITQTDIYELLQIVDELKIENQDDFTLINPAELNYKLRYNNAKVYEELFEAYAVQLVPIDDVMENFPNSSKIIMKLHRLFIEQADRDAFGEYIVGNGDEQLERIEQQLMTLIKSDIRFLKSPLSDETLETFIIVLLSYGVSKCKVLINPNK